jgi:hypothetical protein
MAIDRWLLPLWRSIWRRQPAIPQVKEWLSPKQAIEAFVSPDLLSKHRVTETKFKSLKEQMSTLEAEMAASDGSKREVIEDQLRALKDEVNTIEYLNLHRMSDVMEDLYEKLRKGILVGKGVNVEFGRPCQRYIKPYFWKIYFSVGVFLDALKQTRRSIF